MVKTFSRWVILGSGVYDLVLGIALIATASAAPPANWLLTQTIGAFLLFAGALLVWASREVESRGAVIFWQGLVRLWAAGATLVAFQRGWLDAAAAQGAIPAAIIDVAFALFYVVALMLVWRLPVAAVALGRRVREAGAAAAS